MGRYVKGDPYWIRARYTDHCAACAVLVRAGDQAFFWPKGKRLECDECGAASERRFVAETAAEVF